MMKPPPLHVPHGMCKGGFVFVVPDFGAVVGVGTFAARVGGEGAFHSLMIFRSSYECWCCASCAFRFGDVSWDEYLGQFVTEETVRFVRDGFGEGVLVTAWEGAGCCL